MNNSGNLTSRISHHEGPSAAEPQPKDSFHHEGTKVTKEEKLVFKSDSFADRFSVLRVLRELRGKEKNLGRARQNFMISTDAIRTTKASLRS